MIKPNTDAPDSRDKKRTDGDRAVGDSSSEQERRPIRIQFGMRLLLILMAMVSVAAAVLGGMLRGGPDRYIYVVLGIAAPMGVMILVSVGSQVMRYLERRR